MLWQVHLQADRPSLRREEYFFTLRFESEAGVRFTSNSVAVESALAAWVKIQAGLERHYRDRLSVLRSRLAPALEDLFHPFFPNPASYGKGYSQIFDEEGHELLFTVSEPRWLWFPLELLYHNQQFLGLRHCVARQSVPLHELATRGVQPPAANQEIWALAGDADAGSGLWAVQEQLEFSARRVGEHLSQACERQFNRPASESWVAKLLPSSGHIYFIGHCRPAKDSQEPGLFLLNQWRLPRELLGEQQFKPSMLFLNACHSAAVGVRTAQSDTPLSFPELILRKKIPLFAGHISRITPELAIEAADIFFEEFYDKKKTLAEAWQAARGAQSSMLLKDGSASLLGYQLYAPHPRTRLLESSDQASLHRIELAPLKPKTDFKKLALQRRRTPAWQWLLPLLLLLTAIIAGGAYTLFLLKRPAQPVMTVRPPEIRISKTGHPTIKNGLVHYTRPWLIEDTVNLVANDELTSGNVLVFEQDVLIAPDGVLLIAPGIELRFRPDARLLAHGRIEAVGTEDAPVVFTSAEEGAAGRWAGVFIGPRERDGRSPQAYFEHCVFTNGKGVPLSARPVQPDAGQNWFEHDQLELPAFGRDYTAGSANRRGGAVLVWRSRPQFINCRFENNRAQLGGALYLRNAPSGVEFYNCRFEHNSAGRVGGALFLVMAGTRISDCVFERCAAENAGGAIAVFRDSRLALRRSELRGNRAGISGGALYLYANLRDTSETLKTHRFEDCLFEANTAGRDGGALSFDGPCGHLEGRQLKFHANGLSGEMDEMEGGALFLNPKTAPESPLRISLRSIRLAGNRIFWNAAYAARNHGLLISRGSAAYFGRMENIELDCSNWIVQDNVHFTSAAPLEMDAEIAPAAKSEIEEILSDAERVRNNLRETVDHPAL